MVVKLSLHSLLLGGKSLEPFLLERKQAFFFFLSQSARAVEQIELGKDILEDI